jgi:hypothetical protein
MAAVQMLRLLLLLLLLLLGRWGKAQPDALAALPHKNYHYWCSCCWEGSGRRSPMRLRG